MSKNHESRLLIDLSAADYAFHAGQVFSKLLTDRAFESVRKTGERVVTVAHVADVLHSDFLAELLRRLAEMKDERVLGKTVGEGQSPNSQKAA